MSTSDIKTPPDEPKEREGESAGREGPLPDDADRVSLRGLAPISAPIDLTRSVPELIRRRSKGRFFGRKRLSDRVPFEWLSLGMLLLLAAIYAALKLLSPS
jgi:hypothetical protein